MKAKDLVNKSVEELNNELNALHKERFNLRMQKVAGQTPKTHLYKKVKVGIARIKTILNQKGSRV